VPVERLEEAACWFRGGGREAGGRKERGEAANWEEKGVSGQGWCVLLLLLPEPPPGKLKVSLECW
jgi:hypothetical protein